MSTPPEKPSPEEAQDILAILQYPALLETMTEAEIRALLRRSCYREGENVTVGWGRKVGEPDAPTIATFVSRDGKVFDLWLGGYGHGLFSLDLLVADIAHPTPQELQQVNHLFWKSQLTLPESHGPAFQQFLERIKTPEAANGGTAAPKHQGFFRRMLWKILGKRP